MPEKTLSVEAPNGETYLLTAEEIKRKRSPRLGRVYYFPKNWNLATIVNVWGEKKITEVLEGIIRSRVMKWGDEATAAASAGAKFEDTKAGKKYVWGTGTLDIQQYTEKFLSFFKSFSARGESKKTIMNRLAELYTKIAELTTSDGEFTPEKVAAIRDVGMQIKSLQEDLAEMQTEDDEAEEASSSATVEASV